ncbi:diguanylate cyclase domain-containing protein [Litoribacillus peritrichatus]|uniref:GGDEF domain-containing protein n=1 Tax=Litoribacillus peritrichatus TaxID=718191 RepID=A0ABP7MTD1_9GAMM
MLDMKGTPQFSSCLLEQQTAFFKQETYYILIWDNKIVDISDKFVQLLGFSNKQEVPDYFPELIPPDYPREFLVYFKLFAGHEFRKNYDMKLKGRDNKVITLRFSARQLGEGDGGSVAMLIGEDVTYQQKKLDDLSQDSSLFTYNPYSIAITDAFAKITKVNPKFIKKTHFTEEEVLGANIFDFKHFPGVSNRVVMGRIIAQKDYRAEFLSQTKEGFEYEEDLHVIPVYHYGELVNLLFIGEDISQKKHIIHALEQKAYYDELTGLYRKEVGMSLLYEVCESDQNFGVFFLDYHSFKMINDNFGHDVGDEILCIGSTRLKHGLRKQDIVIRWGGDEFVIIAPNLNDRSDMEVVANKVHNEFLKSMEVQGRHFHVSVDIGGCYCPTSDIPPSARELIKMADSNMYISKQTKQSFCVSEYGMSQSRALLKLRLSG